MEDSVRLFDLNEIGRKILKSFATEHNLLLTPTPLQGASSPTQGPIPELTPYIEVILQRLRHHEGGKEPCHCMIVHE